MELVAVPGLPIVLLSVELVTTIPSFWIVVLAGFGSL
jgi:hypothetical protein